MISEHGWRVRCHSATFMFGRECEDPRQCRALSETLAVGPRPSEWAAGKEAKARQRFQTQSNVQPADVELHGGQESEGLQSGSCSQTVDWTFQTPTSRPRQR